MPGPSRDPAELKPSLVALVGANLWPLAGVLFLEWTVFAVLLLFWVENVVVGAFNVLRMAVARPADLLALPLKIFMIPFFVIHYGLFAMGHGMFVLGIFGAGFPDAEFASPTPFVAAVEGAGLTLPALALVASHGVSFAANYLGAGEYRGVQLGVLMMKPYARVVVLHVVIIGGAFLVTALGSPLLPLALLVVLKIALDAHAHLKEHTGQGLPRALHPSRNRA